MKKARKYVEMHEVAIIGAGFAGIGAGIRLLKKNLNSFVIFERKKEIGGTWRDNTYPGCACDVPSLLYSYSFEPKHDWSRVFSPQAEILDYLKGCVDKYGLQEKIRYNTEIKEAIFIKEDGLWKLTTFQDKVYFARVVISATGPLNAAVYPEIKGRKTFKGATFHSMYWQHQHELEGKKVAVIGTGASAIQFVPKIAEKTEELSVFQRSAPWIVPRLGGRYSEKTHEKFKKKPYIQRFWRAFLYWLLEYRGRAQFGAKRMRKKLTNAALEHMHTSIKDKELREKFTPNYEYGCKRILVSSKYYPTFNKENVNLVTDAITEIQEDGIIDHTGKKHKVDTIIYATGFKTTKYGHLYKAVGLKNHNLFDEWDRKGSQAYYGMTATGMPNFLFMVGPNSGVGHNSIVHMMESQMNYIVDYVQKLKQQPITAYFDLKPQVMQQFNDNIQHKLSKMVWSGACVSYYTRKEDGKNTSLWPGSTASFRRKTKQVRMQDYNIVVEKKSPAIKQLPARRSVLSNVGFSRR